MSEARLPC